jgi:DNA primase
MRTWIDYQALRRQVSMERVLELIEYHPTSRRGPQLRGPCPFHASKTCSPRCFSIHLTKGLFRCFHCGARGNQLDLWSQLHRMSIHDAAIDLGRRFDIFQRDRHPETR